jgi:hypothetical protein
MATFWKKDRQESTIDIKNSHQHDFRVYLQHYIRFPWLMGFSYNYIKKLISGKNHDIKFYKIIGSIHWFGGLASLAFFFISFFYYILRYLVNWESV